MASYRPHARIMRYIDNEGCGFPARNHKWLDQSQLALQLGRWRH
jgi:hypothetical protein